MNRIHAIILSLYIPFLLCGRASATHVANRGSISPVEYGLLNAKTGEERYSILLKTHKLAYKKGVAVDYRGLRNVDITIPQNAVSIPLGQVNDFSNVVFNVTNKAKDFFLFSYVNTPITIMVSGVEIDKGKFGSSSQLHSGKKLLCIEDKNPWVKNRKSYSYGHQRKDILLVENGNAKNRPVMPYNNSQSSPVCKYYEVVYPFLQLTSVTLNRTLGSTSKTYLCKIVGADDVRIQNVVINTPMSDMVDDVAISIQNCTNVKFKKVSINGTYSRSNHSGYGISMNNIWNFYATNLKAKGNWGIFGNNNINTAYIENSEFNRFDVHCYGRDVSFKNVVFFNQYNQFSSTFGRIQFDECTFKHFVPVLYEASYNAYTPHDVVFNKCRFHLDGKRNCLIAAGSLTPEENSRYELRHKCWPNVFINNLRVVVDSEATSFNVFNVALDPKFDGSIHSINNISINGLEFEYGHLTKAFPINIVNRVVKTENPLEVSVNKLIAMPGATLNLNINKGTRRNRFSIRRSNVSNAIYE